VNLWDDLYTLLTELNQPKIVNELYEIISLEGAQGFIQDQVYQGNDIEFKTVFLKGKKSDHGYASEG